MQKFQWSYFLSRSLVLLYLSSYCCQLIFNTITPLELLQLRSPIILAVFMFICQPPQLISLSLSLSLSLFLSLFLSFSLTLSLSLFLSQSFTNSHFPPLPLLQPFPSSDFAMTIDVPLPDLRPVPEIGKYGPC